MNLADFGYEGYPETNQGAPVEAAFSPDGAYAYVSNYSMYGPGFGPEGDDECTPSSGYDDSFVYRISLEKLEIDDAYRVGSVPKVVVVTPDGRFVLVANWCTWDLSVISTKKGREVRRIPMGEYQRGVAVSPGSACTAHGGKDAPTLEAIGLEPPWTHSAVLLTLGRTTTEADVDAAVAAFADAVAALRAMSPLIP